ncbi:MAG: NADH-quinone oxidoreductase subunit J [Candidatus Omnitrophica bacterium]|nr:NADH-quinone oxidoreductase subunit J [Candidatus Omnitrophota bacterium]MBI2174392.1 NADH-quinone oxidoreductase subunit J [Candidatus Omnitrophota bacterium]MBI3010383.1 NADH-quinone oxidoreductase subunit J [Candidatus Omnitrophota bacterium]
MFEAIFFYFCTALLFAAALSVIFNRQPIYSVLSLLAAMFCLAVLYVLLGAYFVAALQILLYAGAVLVLFLFVIMLLNLEPEAIKRMRLFTLRGLGILMAMSLFAILIRIFRASSGRIPVSTPPLDGSVEELGRLLFTTYLIPFEVTSFLILAALIGAVSLAKHR